MHFQTQCPICSKPVDLEMPEDLDRGTAHLMMKHVAPRIAHNDCHDAWQKGQLAARAESILTQRLNELGCLIPPLFQATDEARLEQSWHKRTLAWTYSPKGLLLHGKVNTGKSRCAYALLKREFMAGKRCLAFTHRGFCEEATRSMLDGARHGTKFGELVGRCDLLLIDDFGKCSMVTASGHLRAASEVLFDIFDARCRNMLPTIWTTNVTGSAIEKEWGDHGRALTRRMREFCETIHFGQ